MKTLTIIRRWALSILLVAVMASPAACGPFAPDGPVAWPKLVQCSPSADTLLDTVSRILLDQGQPGETLSDQAQRELEDLARQHGPATIACLVQKVVDGFMAQDSSRMAAGYPAVRGAAAARGRAFLSEHDIEVRQ